LDHDDNVNIIPVQDKFHRVQLTTSYGSSSVIVYQ
jgi:hypothetical protein